MSIASLSIEYWISSFSDPLSILSISLSDSDASGYSLFRSSSIFNSTLCASSSLGLISSNCWITWSYTSFVSLFCWSYFISNGFEPGFSIMLFDLLRVVIDMLLEWGISIFCDLCVDTFCRLYWELDLMREGFLFLLPVGIRGTRAPLDSFFPWLGWTKDWYFLLLPSCLRLDFISSWEIWVSGLLSAYIAED